MKQFKIVIAIITLAIAHLLLMCNAETASQAVPVVDAPIGKIEGVSQGALNVFRGIPYAQPPIGERRWKPPVPVAPWSDVKVAHSYGDACIQPSRKTIGIYSSDISPSSEDCLSLNIWAPKQAQQLPVFVWIHGGALTAGASKEPFYDGSKLAEQGMIVVTINYRLGVLGYLAHPELSAESADKISGNYGLLDQIESLRWLHNNIAAFGGDVSNITIAGESAGALSVVYLMASPVARGLFAKAVVQSAHLSSTPELKQDKYGQFSAEKIGTYIAKKVGAKNLASLRAMDPQQLANSAAAARYLAQPVVDGNVITGQVIDTFASGEQAPVPLLVGFNSGEIHSLKMLVPPVPQSSAEYEKIIRSRYLDLADPFLRLYPSSAMQESIYATARDALFGWASEKIAKSQQAIGQPAYLYLFDHGYPAADKAGLHAFHGSEIPFVFGSFERTTALWPKIPTTKEQQAFSAAMMGYWSEFAKVGTPRAENQPDWPAYGDEKAYMLFGVTPQPMTNLFPGMYELHEASVCRRKNSGQLPWRGNAGLRSPVLTKLVDQCR
ncbi:carboxylesterase/lipase family protein [Neptunicella sp.]|uniref:carboxylesterase/lipase family protein n=1 Tax=Neptunicella sp. TaxID=2125986 RepID=UPI003F690863